MGAIKEEISTELKQAMKNREQLKVDTLRSALSAFTYKRSENGKDDLTNEEEIEVLMKLVKQRNDSISEFTKAGRVELAEKESAEKQILQAYLPAQKSEEEIREIIKNAIVSLPESGRNLGAVMKTVLPLLKGQADGNVIKRIVGEELA